MSEKLDNPLNELVLNLNDKQKEAVYSQDKNVLVIAGPGTGKTRVLVARAAYLLNDIKDDGLIVTITFTNQAAIEIKNRINSIGLDTKNIFSGTFHQFALWLFSNIDFYDLELIDEQDARRLFLKAAKLAGLNNREGRSLYKKRDINRYDCPKNCCVELRYKKLLDEFLFWDFDHLLYDFLRFLRICAKKGKNVPNISHVLIDEFQDVSHVQYEIIKALSNLGANIFAIGDPNQSIYGFRGASPDFIDKLKYDLSNVKEITLDTSYRCPKSILGLSGSVVKSKELNSFSSKKGDIFLLHFKDERSESRWITKKLEELVGSLSIDAIDMGLGAFSEPISLSEIAILYRVNKMADTISKELSRAGIPFYRSDRTCALNHPHIRWIYKLWQASSSNNPEFFLEQLPGGIKRWKDKIIDIRGEIANKTGKDALEILVDSLNLSIESPVVSVLFSMADQIKTASDMALCLRNAQDILGISFEAVRLLSLHAAKGLEFSVVFIIGLEQGLFPLKDADLDEEKRLFYVGITRAKDKLFLSYCDKRDIWIKGKKSYVSLKRSEFLDIIPSGFLNEIKPIKKTKGKNKKKIKPKASQKSLF